MRTWLSSPVACVKFTRERRFFAHGAFSLPELLVVVVVMAIVGALAIPALSKARAKAQAIHCVGHLKNIGLAHRIFATDHGDLFLWQTNFHKLQNLPSDEQVVDIYRTLSNELSAPKIIVCPADVRRAALSWQQLTTNHISYFVGLSAEEKYPQSILGGDCNLTADGKRLYGRVEIPADLRVAWDGTIHKFQGYVVNGDGSVPLGYARLQELFNNSGLATNVFLLP